MVKVEHDKRPFFDPRTERVIDPEWVEAEQSNETAQYYWVETGTRTKTWWVRFIKHYKPSVAKLIEKRTGYRIYPVIEAEGSE